MRSLFPKSSAAFAFEALVVPNSHSDIPSGTNCDPTDVSTMPSQPPTKTELPSGNWDWVLLGVTALTNFET